MEDNENKDTQDKFTSPKKSSIPQVVPGAPKKAPQIQLFGTQSRSQNRARLDKTVEKGRHLFDRLDENEVNKNCN
jgi:hypothetical protein